MIALVTSPKTGRNQKGFHTKIKKSKLKKKKIDTHTQKKFLPCSNTNAL